VAVVARAMWGCKGFEHRWCESSYSIQADKESVSLSSITLSEDEQVLRENDDDGRFRVLLAVLVGQLYFFSHCVALSFPKTRECENAKGL